MYPGHFAAGLALKAAEPRASTLGLMVGVGLLDLVFAVLVAFGIEGGSFNHHLRIPWSHSLLMSGVWASLFAALYWRSGVRVAAAMFLAVFSHWALDVVSHTPDVPLWPHSAVELGYGRLFGGFGGWLELGVTLAGLAVYVAWATRPDHRRRRWGLAVAAVVATYGLEVAVVRSADAS